MILDLDTLVPEPSGSADAVTARLAADPAAYGSVDVAYRTVDSPLGDLLLATTPRGLVRVAFALEGHEAVLADLAARVSPRVLRLPAHLDDAARELDDYFGGRRQGFDLLLDLTLTRGFRREVVERLPTIPYGQTVSYAALAADLGRPSAVRAVGSACGHNPLPVVIPCHRVLRSDGTLGGYLGGLPAKSALLTLEGAA